MPYFGFFRPRITVHGLALRGVLVIALAASSALCRGQETHAWTERENFGLRGPVRSASTTVARPNPDPRGSKPHKLFVDGRADWAVFDAEGRRTEYALGLVHDSTTGISRCIFDADGSKVCNDNQGLQQESRELQTVLPDGSREVTYLEGSRVMTREVTQFGEDGKIAAVRTFLGNGKLHSEELNLPDGDDEWKIYDDAGTVVLDQRTHKPADKNGFERWSYDSAGHLVWDLAIDGEGEVLSKWYETGFRPKVSSSDSLGICRPKICVDYTFDDEGTGRLEKVVEHTPGEGSLEPDAEEHFNLDGILDEKIEIRYSRDGHGNWTVRSVFVWDPSSNVMVEIEQDTRRIEYY